MARASRSKRSLNGSAEYFDRHLALEAWIARTIDLAHSSLTDEIENLVRAELIAKRQRHQVVLVSDGEDKRICMEICNGITTMRSVRPSTWWRNTVDGFIRQRLHSVAKSAYAATRKQMFSTAERCKEGSQVWSATRDTPGSRFKTWHPGRGARKVGYRCPRGIARSARSTPG